MAHLPDYIKHNAKYAKKMVTHECMKGKSLSIFGAGPSLAEVKEVPLTDHAWACNGAINYIKQNTNLRLTHGFCIDQGEEMLGEREWKTTYDVRYLVSTSINPKLTDHLVARKRKLFWFHNYLGIPDPENHVRMDETTSYELELYRTLFQTSVQVGHGLNSVPRAVCLGIAMGFSKITVYGADCAARPDYDPMPWLDTPEYVEWMKGLILYADGRSAFDCYELFSPFCEAPDLNGRRWHTRPDMVVSAQHLLDLQTAFPGRIELVGDTLPNAIRGMTENLPQLTKEGTVIGFGRSGAPIVEEAA
jgi:hypothetical protein